MGLEKITCTGMVRRILDAYDKRDINVLCKYEFGSIKFNTDHLQMYDTGNEIEVIDDNDTEIIINKKFINSNPTVSRIDTGEEIDLDLGNSKIIFTISDF
jgi:hypothetical protein